MITSDRRFGVEIEFFCPDKMSLYNIGHKLPLVDDGSIRHIPHSAEYVSNVLCGKKGEKELLRACEVLKKNRASGDNSCMSVHVHLDGKKDLLTLKSASTLAEARALTKREIVPISNRLARDLNDKAIMFFLCNGGLTPELYPNYRSMVTSVFNNIRYYSLAELSSEPTKNFMFYWIEKEDRFRWLQNMFYFYTQYSQVMEDIVANSRKFGNMYCIPLGLSYDLDTIESCKDINELQTVWYKGRDPMGHYDDSRYHNVNLHSYWNRHGTVEIRSHGGTVDPYKILLWVKLHQKIADKLEGLSIEDFKCNDNLHQNFIDFIEEPILQNYVKRLLGYYSGIIIK